MLALKGDHPRYRKYSKITLDIALAFSHGGSHIKDRPIRFGIPCQQSRNSLF